MTKEKYNNPFKIPVSAETLDKKQTAKKKEENQKSDEGIINLKEDENENPMIANITIKLSPTLRDRYKIECIKEKISMQQDLLNYIAKKARK
jgi:hypothetical protein